MDMIKGLERLQSRVVNLITETECAGAGQLSLLKTLHSDIVHLIHDPSMANPDLLDQMSLRLAHRARAQDELHEESYDTLVVGLRLLARARRHEIASTVGPESKLAGLAPAMQGVAADVAPQRRMGNISKVV